ncbi:MAG TPA: hypothetical protein PKC35_14265 [Leptospiraceae bacterium]|nr:hypothetical protein [Leptospiraceae bacterium]
MGIMKDVHEARTCLNCKNLDGFKYISKNYKPSPGMDGFCLIHKVYISQKVTDSAHGLIIMGDMRSLECKEFERDAGSKIMGKIFGFFG